MKNILFLLMLLCSISVFSQDVIVKKNGTTILCRIVEINSSEVVYKKWTDLKGANYVMDRTSVTAINYENGKKDVFSEVTQNQYSPGNQNTGQQQLNDNALLRMDYNDRNIPAKVKRLKTAAWIGGAILATGGLTLVTISIIDPGALPRQLWVYGGLGGIIAGTAWTGIFLHSANRYQKIADTMVQNTHIIQNEFKLKGGRTLTTSVDLLKDNMLQSNTIGLALRCNF